MIRFLWISAVYWYYDISTTFSLNPTWNNGMMERWNIGAAISLSPHGLSHPTIPVFQHSNIPTFQV
jgi:hypothetical protein